MIRLLVMTDGRRDYIARTVPEFLDRFDRPDLLSELVIHDDSGDPEYRAWLLDVFGRQGFEVVSTTVGRSGFGGAIRSAWQHVRDTSSARFVFHLEDDFTPTRTVPLAAMVHLLDTHPELVQVALRRQPWNAEELAAGGVVEQHPTDYVDVEEHTWIGEEHGGPGAVFYLEHRRFFTTNPNLYRRELVDETEWPAGSQSEGRYGIELLRQDPARRFAFYGSRDSGPWVEHIGRDRVGTGY